MNKCLIIFLCCIAMPLHAPAASTADMLRQLAEAKNDSEKVAAYKSLILHFGRGNQDSLQYYTTQSLAYCKKNNYRIGEAAIVGQLGLLDHSEGRLSLAEQRFTYALQIYREQHDTKGIADALCNIGALQATKGDFTESAKNEIAAVKLMDSLNDKNGLIVGYMNIASTYIQQNDSANAKKYLKLAEDISKQIPVTDKTIALYNMIGAEHALNGELDKALEYFLKDLKLSDKPEFTDSHVECLLYLGNVYHDLGNMTLAMKYLNDGLDIANRKNLPEVKSNILLEIAMLKKENDPAGALKDLEEAAGICRQMDNKIFLVNVYAEIAALYKAQGKYKEALQLTEQKQVLADSIFNVNKAREIASIGAIYELEKSNLKVKDLEILSNKTASQRNLVLAIAGVIALLTAILLVVYRKTIILNRQLKAHQDELKKLHETKDKFFSIIGHDLRSPMAMIPTILDILEDEDIAEEEKRPFMSAMRSHAHASMEMLDKLLFWGRSLVKGIMIQEQSIYLDEFIEENIALKKMAAEEKNIDIENKVPGGLKVHADATHCDFVIRNLLSNAIKYTRPNGKIEISADTTAKAGYTVFCVKDNGVGIDENRLNAIFHPLQSIEGTNKEKGTGIGLMLCKEFIVQNGGNIWVKSEPGKGTTFYFSLKKAA